jgi:hypothetical protein
MPLVLVNAVTVTDLTHIVAFILENQSRDQHETELFKWYHHINNFYFLLTTSKKIF